MPLGKLLIGTGIALVVAGVLVQFAPALRLGRLPGDVSFGGANWRVFAPIGTSIVLSIAFTLVLALVSAFSRR